MKELKAKKQRVKKIILRLKKLLPGAKIVLKYSNNWELLVAVMLSAQCTDKMVNKVTEKLFKKYKTLNDYIKANPKGFEKDIKSCGFYKNKTKNILTTAKIIKEKFNARVPNTMGDLLTLRGVARKTANVVLGNAFHIYDGIAVDTHVRRLSKLYGLTNHDDPDKIEQDLMKIIPKKDWFKFTYLMIDYGRKYCPAKKHDHKNCPLVKILRNSNKGNA
ncbi:endonuclease III [Candidatus Roizmanbacteria bacterium]|nr:endonuclease III [Candidatus Roizmanbacteria bacterium]